MAVVEDSAASGPDAGNAGVNDGTSDSLSSAINAALSETMGDDPDPAEQSDGEPDQAKETAETDRRGSEDADADRPTTNAKATNGKATSNGAAKFEAPRHWPEADRKAFAAMPPEGQQIIRRLAKDLEGGFTKRSQELGDKARYADAVRGLIDDRTRQQIARTGANELQYLAYLHGIQEYSARDPVGYVRWAMQNLGVTPEHLFPAQPQPGQQQQNAQQELDALLSDPKVKQLESELAQLKGQWNQRQQAEHQAYQNRLVQHRQGLQGMAASFRNSLDDHGQLAYPHFDTVHRHMGALMETDPQLARMIDGPEKMKAAYDMAVWARPDLRQALVEQETARRVAAAEKARDVARAKSVTAIKPSAGVSPTNLRPKSLDDIISSAMSKAGVS